MISADDFLNDAGDRPDIVNGRYRLPHPETGVEQSWTRATTHATLPEDSYGLTRWQLRELVRGLALRPDLLRLIEASGTELDVRVADDWIETAHHAAEIDRKANDGTALHLALRSVDQAWPDLGDNLIDLVPEWALPAAQSYVAELRRHGLEPIPQMTERQVVNLALGVAGTLDNLYHEADGSVVVGDKKTGRLDYPERAYAIQLATYAGADYMVDPHGGPPIPLSYLEVRRDYGVVVHVDPESGACSIYRIDLRRGQLGANLAADVRSWRNERHLLLPYVAPAGRFERIAAEIPIPRDVVETNPASPFDAGTHAGQLATKLTDAAAQRREQLDVSVPGGPPESIAGQIIVTDQVGLPATLGPRAEPATADAFAELMKLDKAALQDMLRKLDPSATLAHQRKVLASKILAAQARAAGQPVVPPILTRDEPLAPAPPAPMPWPMVDSTALLAEIAAADSVNALAAIHQRVTRAAGDQAWTDQLTEAARARTLVLDNMGAMGRIQWRGVACTPAAAIGMVADSHEMAQLWSLVTTGGGNEAAWTSELNDLAHARLREIDAAAAQKPPTNPFG